ncbi:MAG: hypothetical protein AAF744_04300 [Pseudomonadota bacterium]
MTSLRFTLAAALAMAGTTAGTALAQDNRLVVTAAFDVAANWAMYSSESYIGTRVGCYEGLTRVNNELRVEPLLATSWEQTDDNTWVFQLREGVSF